MKVGGPTKEAATEERRRTMRRSRKVENTNSEEETCLKLARELGKSRRERQEDRET